MEIRSQKKLKRVVLTGVGAITPLGNDWQSTWESLKKGKSCISKISKVDTSKLKTKIAAEIKGFDAKDYIDRKLANKLDSVSQFALIASNQAIETSGILSSDLQKHRIGVIWATGNGGAETYDKSLEEYYRNNQDRKLSPYFVPKVLLDTSSGIISIAHGLTGVNYTTVSACASGSTALADAFNYIQWGKADAIITGGSDAPICPSLISGFNSLTALSTTNETPTLASRPFDAARNGFVMGEGATALVLESLDSAIERGANIISEIVGSGINADAYHMTSGHPEGIGAANCMQLAIDEAGIKFKDLDYLNAHATSTPVGDLAESKAIERLNINEKSPLIGATKSMTGHLMGAAGALEGAICAMTTHDDVIPPNINLTHLDDRISKNLSFVGNTCVNKKVNYAMSNSFGFGGHNSCVIFKKYSP